MLPGGYSGLTKNRSYGHSSVRCEGYVAAYYNYILGFKSAVFPTQYCQHLGENRHVAR